MDETVLRLLHNSGFSEKEAAVYAALLERGAATVTQIAEYTNLKRPIIYITLDHLAKRGAASKVPGRRTLTYAPGDPAAINARLTTAAKDFNGMLPYLLSMSNRSGRRPKIRYSDTEESIWDAFRATSTCKDVVLVTSYARLVQQFPKRTEDWLRSVERGTYSLPNWKHIVPDTAPEKAIARRLVKVGQSLRLLKAGDAHALDLAVYDETVSITSVDTQPFLVSLESSALAASMRGIFDVLWQSAKPIH